ncbi:MAG: A/G-specific adenine glycosylase, partial [Clostridia bacterium]|nr:A/G-specific adenine glycosylase [Clostridia bacterium]
MHVFSEELLAWHDAHARELPWRGERDPYRIWISEIMLQQTTTQTVKGYYARFLAAFPTVEALAQAPEQEVLKLWEGLGYYSRARNLQKAAKLVAGELGGRLPDTAEALRKLPGIGDYTAGAIASMAYERPELAMDGILV